MEEIDIYDANLTKIGKMERRKAHLDGHWHRTFHCWLYRGGAETAILFQLRSPNSTNFPDVLDVSAAGHLEAGESLEDGIREVQEELGIDASFDSLFFLGERVEVADEFHNGHHNREYQSVFMLRDDRNLSEYKPPVEEIWGLFWVPLESGMRLMAGQIGELEIEGIVYNPETKVFDPKKRTVTTADFLPRIQRYYLTAMVAAERLLDGKEFVGIS